MSLSRQEINLRRLLAKCELLIKTHKNDERFPKYITSLEDMLLEVKKLIEPSNNAIILYQKRINTLKNELGMTITELDAGDLQSMREDLFNLRQRNVSKTKTYSDLEDIIKYNENIQQKITNDMLSLTKSLKEQSELANKIIKKDTDVLTKSSVITDQNKSKLENESSKLAEHSRKAWKCWMWVMLLLVMVVFINMVLFMKVMKKKY